MAKQATKGSFVKGDKRINRDGRPKNSTDLSALFRRIGAEVATKKDGSPLIGPDGKPMTVLEAIARQWAQNPRQQGDFVDRAYGKVPQGVEPQDVINWTPDEWRKEAATRYSEAANTLATFDDETPDE
jgi:hypothetical protein